MCAQASDCVLLLENEMAGDVCKRLMNIASPAFRDLNRVLARALCLLLMPATLDSAPGVPVDIRTIVTHLCAHPVRGAPLLFPTLPASHAPSPTQAFRLVSARMLPLVRPLSTPVTCMPFRRGFVLRSRARRCQCTACHSVCTRGPAL